jgi:hypothetical protein
MQFSLVRLQCNSGFTWPLVIRDDNISQFLIQMICVPHFKWLLMLDINSNNDLLSPWVFRPENKEANKSFIVSTRSIVDWAILSGLQKLLMLFLLFFMGDNTLPFCLSQFKYGFPITYSYYCFQLVSRYIIQCSQLQATDSNSGSLTQKEMFTQTSG